MALAWVLDEKKGVVLHGDTADKLIVTRVSAAAAASATASASLFADARHPGCRGRLPDPGCLRAAGDHLAGCGRARGSARRGLGRRCRSFERVIDEAIAALCAEAWARWASMHELTLDYLKTRAIRARDRRFQIRQHRAVDMLIALEQARPAWRCSHNDGRGGRSPRTAQRALGRKGADRPSARLIGQQAVQLHGGIGMTMEYKSAITSTHTMIDTMFGDAGLSFAGNSPAARIAGG